MYSSASKIGEIRQELHPYLKEEFDLDKYEEFKNKYHDILKLYETHSINDFRGDYLRAKLETPKYYKYSILEKILNITKVSFLYFLNFLSYFLVIGFLCYILYFLTFAEKVS
mgnify:CR=1 FL=1